MGKKKQQHNGVEVIAFNYHLGQDVTDRYEGSQFWSEVDDETGYLYISATPEKDHAYEGYHAAYRPGTWDLVRCI